MASKTVFSFLASIAVVIMLSMGTRADDLDGKFRSDAEKFNLLNKAMAQWNVVSQWLIEYEIVPSSKTGGFSSSHRIMAVSAPGEFYYLGAHFNRIHPWQVDPFSQEFFVHQGGTYLWRWPFNRAYSEGQMKIGGAIPGSIPTDVLLTIIPRWSLTDYRIPLGDSGGPIIAVEALRSADYHLLSRSETIAGEDCAGFDYKDGVDCIWIAKNKGGCIMQRDFQNPNSRRLFERIITDRVDQIAPGIWLPTEFRNQFFSVSQGTNENIIEREFMVHIIRCMLNDVVPKSTFIPTLRLGSIRYDKDNQFTQVSPGGEALLDDIVNFMVKYAHLPTKLVSRSHPFRWLLVGLASGLAAGLFLFPINRSRLSKVKEPVPENTSPANH
jgi:hypothetical protein